MDRPSNRRVDQVGEKIKRGEPLTESDLEVFHALLEVHDAASAETASLISEIVGPHGNLLAPVTRTKTFVTTSEKIRRGRIRLSQIHDLAGARLIVENRRDQDRIVDAIAATFSEVKPILDRRDEPSHGYRAVHVVVRHAGCWIEVQVRTRRQHVWAEITERLGDRWGRQIRYGGIPDDPDRDDGRGARRDFVELLAEISELLDVFERGEKDLLHHPIVPVDREAQRAFEIAAEANASAGGSFDRLMNEVRSWLELESEDK